MPLLSSGEQSVAALQEGKSRLRQAETAGSSPESASPSRPYTAEVGCCSPCTRKDGSPAAILTLWVAPELLEHLCKGQQLEIVLPPAVAIPEPEWAIAEAAAFRKALERMALDYESVCDLCEGRKMARPSRLGPELRAGVLRRLQTPDGRAAYDTAASKRVSLLAAARALSVAERSAAAARAGTDTEPARLSGRELELLLSAAGPTSVEELGVEQPTAPTAVRCSTCDAEIVWITTKAGKPIACNPELIRAAPRGNGGRVTLILDDGSQRTAARDHDGLIVGRITHFATCPQANQHRRPKGGK